MSENQYKYPSGRSANPEQVEDLGAYPPPQAAPAPSTAKATQAPANSDTLKKLAARRRPSFTPTTPVVPPAPKPETAQPDPKLESGRRHRGTTAKLPVSLIQGVGAVRDRTRFSAGTVVIRAINMVRPQLPELLRETTPEPQPGFSTMEVVARPVDKHDPIGVFAYRLSGDDFEMLNQLVHDLGARDRTHLIRVALTAYLKDEP